MNNVLFWLVIEEMLDRRKPVNKIFIGVIKSHYIEGKSMAQIAKEKRVSIARIVQIKSHAIRILQNPIRKRLLNPRGY